MKKDPTAAARVIRTSIALPKWLHYKVALASVETEKPLTEIVRQALVQWLQTLPRDIRMKIESAYAHATVRSFSSSEEAFAFDFDAHHPPSPQLKGGKRGGKR